MRIDLPQCNLKTCLYSFDGNCTNKNRYETCEYQLNKIQLEELVIEKRILKQKRINLYERLELVNEARKQAIMVFMKKLKEHSCFYDLDNYHSFEAVDIDVVDDIVKEVLGEDYDN